MHESVANEVLALVAMKKPSSHTEHVGSSVVVPITDVYVPARQLVCAMHTSLVSMSVSDSAPFVLNVPLAQSTHSVSVVTVPTDVVYVPAGQKEGGVHVASAHSHVDVSGLVANRS